MSGPEAYLAEFAERGFREGDEPRFRETWEFLERAYFARLALATESMGGWRDRFHAAAQETARLVEAFPRAARFLIVDAIAAGQVGSECRGLLVSRLVASIDTARRELAEPDAVPEVTAGWIVAIFFDRIYRRLTSDSGPDLPSQLPELMFLAISAYFGTEAGLEELIRER